MAGPARLRFDQVFVGDMALEDVADVLNTLMTGADPTTQGTRSILPMSMQDAAAAAVDHTFGTGIFASVAAVGRSSGRGR